MKQYARLIILLLAMVSATANAQQYRKATWYNTAPEKWQFFAGADICFPEKGLKNPAFGINAGYVKNYGGYAHVLYNKGTKDGEKWIDANNIKYNYYTNGNYHHSFFAAMGGGMLRLWCPLYFHAGAGIYTEQIAYQHMDGTYLITRSEEQQFAFEAGLSLRITNLMIHSNVIKAKDMALSFGLSYCF